MAESQAPSKQADAALPDKGGSDNTESKQDSHSQGKILDFIKRYRPSKSEVIHDILDGRYRVELSTPLPEFNTSSAKAFAASDQLEPGRLLYALICAPNMAVRRRVIQALKPVNNPYILQLVAAGPVELSRPEEERFVLVYERPQGKRLYDLVAAHKTEFNPEFLTEHIIAPLASAINQFTELEISHGCINPKNIYFQDMAVLGPCAAEPCGFSQPFYFEPLERMQALPTGKGEGTTSHDFYAVAVTLLYVLYGEEHFTGFTPQKLIRAMLRDGAYNTLTRNKDLPEAFNDFFRGMLNQNIDDRWNYRHIKPWLAGKRYNVLSPPAPLEAMRPFEHGNTEANNARELAYIFASDWDNMVVPVQNGQLAHWVSVSLRKKELSDNIGRISKTVAEMTTKQDMPLTEQLMRVIMLLDPFGPIRVKQLAFHLDGIDSLAIELSVSNAKQELQYLSKFIEFNMSNFWLELQRKGREYHMPAAVNSILIRLDKLRAIIRNHGMGFGLERMLYELNPDMQCMSPMFVDYHVTTLPQLLKRLDQVAASKSGDQDPVDRHIAAFIAAKLNMTHEIRLNQLATLPGLATHHAVVALFLLNMAQTKAGTMQLPGLTHWIAGRIIPALEVIHSKTLRQKLKAKILDQAEAGYIRLLADTILTSEHAVNDATGFQRAWILYQTNAARIDNYRRSKNLDKEAAKFGYSLSKTLAYLALVISLCTMLRKTMMI